ncbi:MAG: hypothetical protein B6242_08435 [Anaerolineaceae bacterium 4572_78]|nr:MAG: hypothetical protein B6242_08435 [Anaerolineaceae bacterium 4572_78]
MIPKKDVDDFRFPECTILIIEDSPYNLKVITDYLGGLGFKILMARHGEAGLQRAIYSLPDLVLLDIMMPGMDGFEVCRQLKNNEQTMDIPVIFMTALTDMANKFKGFSVGGVDYITKPFQHEEVLARITTHLRIKKLTERLQQKNEILEKKATELAELNASKDKFFSIMAHDLRGPFQPLVGLSQMLAQTPEKFSTQDIRELGKRLYFSSKNISSLLENLLAWSRMQMGHLEYEPSQLDLYQVMQQTIRLLEINAMEKDINIQNNIPEEMIVYTDKNILKTVIRNLTSNALKFTDKGGRVTVSVEEINKLEDCSTCIIMSIADTGIGISQDNLAKLFKLDIHHTTKGTANEHGTGLGLIISKEMVEIYGGKILVESSLGEGTTVKFTIPIV